ncbi:uncharacterized protein LOC115877127 [Sitophilus oryzae]|uniref:Uncharacterized protein LOC115877127 n=1 Tax=Sitophilus oryzae TaxID=7048 RepID=A0A6J2XDS0_SITOR|nr:uncharacterized protein LOC115877127 [Sitophilus oryzae]
MDLKYVLLTIIKILISTGLVIHAQGNSLMGGHLDNKNYTEENYAYDYDYTDSLESTTAKINQSHNSIPAQSEEIPDPSALVRPGYNLPDDIFNEGKPFYVEKDPSTGKIDFNHKSTSTKNNDSNDDDVDDYVDDTPSDDVYDKKNIDRKDGNIDNYGSHRYNAVNQLTTNFHDFLNLPVRYNPEKYVPPLMSSPYASTKIQGSVNKYHNHKDTFGVPKTTTTKRPTANPTYYTTGSYFTPRTTQRTMATTPVATTTTRPTTMKIYPEITTKSVSLLNSDMSHPSFNEEYDYYDSSTEVTHEIKSNNKLTTPDVKHIYLTSTITPSTSTSRVLSLFEQLFGSYDEMTSTEEPKTTSAPINPPPKIPDNTFITTTPKIEKILTTKNYPNIHAGPPSLQTEASTDLDTNYEYNDEDDYNNPKLTDNIAVENNVHAEETLKVQPLDVKFEKTSPINNFHNVQKNTTIKIKEQVTTVKPTSSSELYSSKTEPATIPIFFTSTKATTTTTTIPSTTTTTTTQATTSRVTSLPLGDNHINAPVHRDPIIVATQNLREKLNSEKVKHETHPQLTVQLPFPQNQQRPINSLVPSTSNIHIAPDQDTVSFVVGQHQSVGGPGQYVGVALKESPYDGNPFRPLYGHEASYSSNSDTNGPQIAFKPQTHEIAGSSVTIQPHQNSEASLAIGMPISGIKQIKGQVMDDSIDHDDKVQFPQESVNKIIFPEENKILKPNSIPSRFEQKLPVPTPTREVLKLHSNPITHQLPSDLTPPLEKDILPVRYEPSERPVRPPWDPRPGHFYNGKPEYVRPPRPRPEVAYKRIDNLPNILPQFRPNLKHYHSHGSPYIFDQRFNRQPLLERPSNRPIGYFEKMLPPVRPPPHTYPQKNVLKNSPPQIEERRPIALALQSLDNQTPIAEDRIMNEDPRPVETQNSPELNLYQTPPNIQIANKRHSIANEEVETLQMIQAKTEKEKEKPERLPIKEVDGETLKILAQEATRNTTNNKTIYRVYPVEAGINMDNSKDSEGVIVGTRGELPLPPSKIENDFNFQNHDRNDAPILKPHPKPPTFPTKSDFPYPLERPDSVLGHSNVPDNKLDDGPDNYNQWNNIGENTESRIVTGGKNKYNSNQISVTLKTYTEKPIAIAYTPTDPSMSSDKYSMPNYGSPVIPEIRPGVIENIEPNLKKKYQAPIIVSHHTYSNHKSDADVDSSLPDQQDFQAPFQASVNVDSAVNQGWSVVRDRGKPASSDDTETTTIPLATTSEFDMENFKPQLIGGFQPLYSYPEAVEKKQLSIPERQEK